MFYCEHDHLCDKNIKIKTGNHCDCFRDVAKCLYSCDTCPDKYNCDTSDYNRDKVKLIEIYE
jgi:hypothetical protein